MIKPIAIVGMSCVYPDARTPVELWENALAGRRAFRRIPRERLRYEDYFDADRMAPDCTYAAEAAVIEGYEFDRVAFRVSGSAYRSADLTHWLALDMASCALADAGLPNGEGLDRITTGVVLGNTLTGEFSRANLMRLRWPYVRRVLDASLQEQGWTDGRRREFLERLEVRYKAPFPAVGEETLAGGLSNTIAGRICNQFDFKGGGYTVDGACASSLLAVAQACSSLAAGDIDAALAGGVDLSLDPFEIVGFAKAGALAPELMRVYDVRSAGLWPGEGCGFVMLMRLEDAVAQGRRIYALIRGWGVSSDGAGGITRPEVDGQMQALRRAYCRAGYGIDTVEYFEGHGTGTSVGDAAELQVLSRARREGPPGAAPAAIGTIKANIGHTKAAAGVAGLIKATLAIHTQTLPPTTGCEEPHPELTGPSPALRVLRDAEPWPENRPLRAGVSAMGFGGINTHVTLEGVANLRRRGLGRRERRLAASAQDAELFLFGAADANGLAQEVEKVLAFAPRLSRSELTDLAATMERSLDPTRTRAAILASTPAELADRLDRLRSWIEARNTTKLDLQSGVFLGGAGAAPRLAFLFPGQGSPVNPDGGALLRRFEFVRELYDRACLPVDAGGIATSVAQPVLVTASLAGLRVLDRLGVTAGAAIGHSLGEITALHWAGALDETALLRIARVRGRAMEELGSPTGTMAAIAAAAHDVSSLINGQSVSIVGFNSPRQTVVAGEAEAVNRLLDRARARGLRTTRLPVSHAFHTPLVAAAVPVLARQLSQESINAPTRPVVSTVTGGVLEPQHDLREILCRQVTSPVRFLDAIRAMAGDVDLFIEVGPGEVLTGLAADSVPTPAVALDACGPSLKGLLKAVGAAFVLGAPVDHKALFRARFTRPFDMDWKPTFFASPCEQAPTPAVEAVRRFAPARTPGEDTSPPMPAASPLELVRQLVARRTELPISAVRDDSRMLRDLHLNSITVGELVSEAARALGLPPLVGLTDFANATVFKVAQALEELARSGGATAAGDRQGAPPGLDSWVRPFTVEWTERPLPPRPAGSGSRRRAWQVIAPTGHPLAAALHGLFPEAEGVGVVVCLPPEPGDAHARLLLQGARAALASELEPGVVFVLVQHGWGSGGFARTLHLEHPEITTCVVNVPIDHPQSATWVLQEAMAAQGCVEARYDATGRRSEPRLKPLALAEPDGDLPIGPGDILLVTGGGKGIAAECALALGRKSGAQLVLLGRSVPSADAELAANLERMAAAGLRCLYCAADVTDADAVRTALAGVERELGRITAFVHGAGTNVPKPVSSLDESSFERTLAPKIQGARNVLAAIQPGQLRLLVTFGSIIARSGLPGEADYAVANEWLAHLTAEFQVANPGCRCLAAEWSVWSGVGMGQRLGRIEALRQQGITPISPETGVGILDQLLRHTLPSVAIVVTGRFGDLPTVKMEKPDLPFLRFLERARVFYPGVELVVDSVLSSDTDPYVEEHVYEGERLFPAVMGMEAMAQAAMALAGSEDPPCFEDVKLSRPVVVPRDGPVTIRVAALQRKPGEVDVALRSESSGFQIDHFRATCRFAPGAERLRGPEPELKSDLAALRSNRVPLEPVRDLYEELLFHTGRFQRVKNYRLLRATECVVQVEPDAGAVWFGRYLPQQRVLGDTGVRDAAIHAIQACIPHAQLLPVGVKRVSIGKLPCLLERLQAAGRLPELLVHARQQSRDGDTFHYDVELLGEDGSVLEQWTGLRLRKVAELPRRTPWTRALLGPYIERRVEELFAPSRIGIAVVLEQGGTGGRSGRTEAAMRQLLGEHTPVLRRPDGKPELNGDATVSVAHAGDLTLAVSGPAPIACDLEAISARPSPVWRDLLGPERFSLAGRLSREAAEDFETSATRVWTALECLKKAGALDGAPLVLSTVNRDGWILLSAGTLAIATFPARMQGAPGVLGVAVLAGAGELP